VVFSDSFADVENIHIKTKYLKMKQRMFILGMISLLEVLRHREYRKGRLRSMWI
jgi:hypothetical protein